MCSMTMDVRAEKVDMEIAEALLKMAKQVLASSWDPSKKALANERMAFASCRNPSKRSFMNKKMATASWMMTSTICWEPVKMAVMSC